MRLPDYLMPHTVTVRPYAGRSSTGKVYGPPFPLRCMARGKRRMVRDASGTEVLSELTLYAALEAADTAPAGSIVTWRGDDTEVLASIPQDDGGMGAPQHTEVVCQ